MTRRIACLQNPGIRFTPAGAQQLHQPALPIQAVESLVGRRMRRDAPARRRGVRLASKVFFGGGVPAPDDESRYSALASAELQAARGVQRNEGDFTDDGSQALAFQALFHRGQYVAVLPGLAV